MSQDRTNAGGTKDVVDATTVVQRASAVGPSSELSSERRKLIGFAADGTHSVADLARRSNIPVGIAAGLVCELVTIQYLHVSKEPTATAEVAPTDTTSLNVLESVLNGIASL